MLKTRITELFDIERPIIRGGLMWVAKAELTSAVANAGGIGFMTALTFQEAEDLRAEIRRCRKLTDKPFGVNLTLCFRACGQRNAGRRADRQRGALRPGQSMGFIHDIPTCRELLDRIMTQAEAIIKEKFAQVITSLSKAPFERR